MENGCFLKANFDIKEQVMIASWITAKTDRPFYARKSIMVKGEVESARAKVCGLGQFNFYINGEKISDHLLDPGWSDYNKYIQYVTFDVTDAIVPGANVLGAEVGNGWYIMNNEHYSFHFPEFMPENPNPYKPFGNSLVLFVELTVIYTDGSTEIFKTDDSWRTAKHPVLQSNVYSSETMDGRLRKYGWGEIDYDDSDWDFAFMADEADVAKGELREQKHPETKALRTFEGEYIGDANGRKIYDLKQNMSGILHVQVKGKAGDKIEMYPAEKLTADGDVDQMAKNWVMIDNVCTYIIGQDNHAEQFTNTFTYFAGRYIGINAPADVEIEAVYADYITSAWDSVGDFDCDDERFMKILALVDRAVEANMLAGVHTDCPTIERFAWQEPNHLMAPAIMFMKNGRLLWEKFFLDMKMCQHKAGDKFFDMAGNDYMVPEGLVPAQAPCFLPNVLPVPGLGDFYDIIPWGSSCILGLRWHYRYYGDIDVVREYYDTGCKYFAHELTKRDENGFIKHGLGDWGNPTGDFAKANIETAFLYADAIALSEFAEILGKTKDYDYYVSIAKEIKDNYNEKLLIKHPRYGFMCYRNFDKADEVVMTQACEALPLYFGLVPDNAIIDVEQAFRHVMEESSSFMTGEVGQPYIIATMAKLGMHDMICDFILKEEHPSYYAFVLAGETTLGEYWEDNPRSHCHDMMGHIIEWYYTGIAGIKSQAPAFKKVLIEPYLPASMNHMHCFFESASGDIEVELTREDGQIRLDVNVDDGIELEVSRKYIGEYK